MEVCLKDALILEHWNRFQKFKRLNWLEFNFLLIGHTVRFNLSTRQRDLRDKITTTQVCWNYLLSDPVAIVYCVTENMSILFYILFYPENLYNREDRIWLVITSHVLSGCVIPPFLLKIFLLSVLFGALWQYNI